MNRKTVFAWCISFLILTMSWASCGVKSSYYQKQVPVPNAKWASGFMPAFELDITDTTAKYGCYLLMRHDESYPNSNLWFRMKVKEPGSKTWIDGPRLEVELADVEGKWLGRGMGGIWEHKVWIDTRDFLQFSHAGTYEIKIEQLMRYNPLPAVLTVGLCVTKLATK
jgi:gliding motility-associated lipoprotein GldH